MSFDFGFSPFELLQHSEKTIPKTPILKNVFFFLTKNLLAPKTSKTKEDTQVVQCGCICPPSSVWVQDKYSNLQLILNTGAYSVAATLPRWWGVRHWSYLMFMRRPAVSWTETGAKLSQTEPKWNDERNGSEGAPSDRIPAVFMETSNQV